MCSMLPIYDFADNLSGGGQRVAVLVAIMEQPLAFWGLKPRKQLIEANNCAGVSQAKEKSWEFGFKANIISKD